MSLFQIGNIKIFSEVRKSEFKTGVTQFKNFHYWPIIKNRAFPFTDSPQSCNFVVPIATNAMGKKSIKNLVGQPIFKQILNLIPREVVNRVIIKHQSDPYYKSFSSWDELVTILFGIFERCDSARELCDSVAATSGKLNYLGMECAPA